MTTTLTSTSPIKNFMTYVPITVSPDMPLSDARDRMAREKIRHLPVLKDGHVVGILSAVDIMLIEDLSVFAPYDTTVGEAMTKNPYTADATASIAEVVRTMAEKNVGAVLITNNNEAPLGIFTDTDAARVLSEFLGKAA